MKTLKSFFIIVILVTAFTNNNMSSMGKSFVYELKLDITRLTDDRMTGTYYHAVRKQTDSSPFITSDNSYIIPGKEDILRWCALSRDLLDVPRLAKKSRKHWRGDYKYGDTLLVSVVDNTKGWYSEKIIGKWIVHDCMNKRFSNAIDFLVSVDYLKGGKWTNLRVCKIETKNPFPYKYMVDIIGISQK